MGKNRENKPGYKMTSLGWIPKDWDIKKIGTISKVTAGATPSTVNKSFWGGDIRWMNSGELNQKKVYEVSGRITKEGLNNSSTRILPVNCILVGLAGQGKTRGTVAINKVELCTNQSIAAIYPCKEFSEEYLFYNLDARYEELRKLSTGDGGRGGLNLQLISSLLVACPPLSEQKAIANVLSTWDKAIENRKLIIENLELRKKYLMQQLLTSKKRLPGFSGEWKEVRISDIFDRVTRTNTENNTTVVTISAQRGFVRQEEFFNKIIASKITDNYFLVYKGEFCYNKSYCNGYPWGAIKRLNDFDKAVVTTLYICFGLKNTKAFSGDFFEYYFDANLLDKGLTQIAHEGGRAHGLLNVTPNDFFNLKITIPDYNEQIRIAEILKSSSDEIQLSKRKLNSIKEQKKGLMQVLLTGKKRIKI